MVFISIYFFDIIGKILIKKCENLCDIGGGIILLCKIRENLFCVKIIPDRLRICIFQSVKLLLHHMAAFFFFFGRTAGKKEKTQTEKQLYIFALDHSFTLHFNI